MALKRPLFQPLAIIVGIPTFTHQMQRSKTRYDWYITEVEGHRASLCDIESIKGE